MEYLISSNVHLLTSSQFTNDSSFCRAESVGLTDTHTHTHTHTHVHHTQMLHTLALAALHHRVKWPKLADSVAPPPPCVLFFFITLRSDTGSEVSEATHSACWR